MLKNSNLPPSHLFTVRYLTEFFAQVLFSGLDTKEPKYFEKRQMKKLRTYRITSIILMIVCTALLIHSNYQRHRSAEIVDQYFDLQGEYEKIFDDVQELEDYSQRLEEQVDILSGYIDPADWIEIDSINPAVE